jgi:glycerol dehydrogenase-like iron-containing ADH family enzyme
MLIDRRCRKLLFRHVNSHDFLVKILTPEFVHLSEIVFAVSGLVGGFGDKYARNAAAHAMHDASLLRLLLSPA